MWKQIHHKNLFNLQRSVLAAGCIFAAVTAPAQVAAPAPAQPVLREDLTAVKLPHGELVLPLPPSEGFVLHLADGKLVPSPVLAPGKTGRDLLAAMRDIHTGDLLYPVPATLIVVSGTATDLGEHYLSDFNDPPPPAPKDIPADPDRPHSLPGTFNAIRAGHVFSIVTTDGKYAVIRLLRCQADGALIQYIYQPDGTLQFDIPKSQPIPLPPAPAAVAVTSPPIAPTSPAPIPAAPPSTPTPVAVTTPLIPAPAAPLAAPTTVTLGTPAPLSASPPPTLPQFSSPHDDVLVPYLSNHLAQRQKMIEQRLVIVKSPARTEKEISAKNDAIEELGEMAANEAIGTLIDQIAFFNSLARSRQFSVEICHPAVVALRKIGKPASLAAIKAIGQLPLEAPAADEDPLRTPSYKLWLLTMVIQGVEGNEVAEYMLTRAAQKADIAHRPLYEQAVHDLREP